MHKEFIKAVDENKVLIIYQKGLRLATYISVQDEDRCATTFNAYLRSCGYDSGCEGEDTMPIRTDAPAQLLASHYNSLTGHNKSFQVIWLP